MRILFNQNLMFQRKLRSEEEADFSRVLKQAKEKVGNTGHSILIVPTPSLPQSSATNTGMGNFLDSEALKFVDFAKQYWGINTIQVLPDGKYKHTKDGGFLPYSGSAFDYGNHIINLDLLTKDEFGNILNKTEVEKVVKSNNSDVVNFENILTPDSETEIALKKAFQELKKNDTPQKKELLIEFAKFKDSNKDWLEAKSVYAMLTDKYKNSNYHHWNYFDKNFYNLDVVTFEERNLAIEGLKKSEHAEAGEFFAFKQFIADKHHFLAKNELNKRGVKLSGDVLLGFSPDEIWANPKSFIKKGSLGWGISALDLDSDLGKDLLRRKINKFAQRYDSIRIDASWSYSTQSLKGKDDEVLSRKVYEGKILDIIDDEFKKVKGKDFKSEDIMHEFLAKLEDFDIYDGPRLKTFVENRTKINCSRSMHEDWGSVENFRRRGWDDNSYVHGTANHDCPSMRLQFADAGKREAQANVLSKILKIPKEKLASLNEFINAKFAEPMRAKHNMVFFSDALGYDVSYKENVAGKDAYRLKVNEGYSDKFFNSLEKGAGFNIMDALEKAFVAEGLDKKDPELFDEIVKYRKILQGKEEDLVKETSKKKSSGTGFKTTMIYVGVAACAALLSYLLFSNKNRVERHNPEN